MTAIAAVLVLSAGLPAAARAQSQSGGPTAAMDGEWHYTITPYFWMTGIKGSVSVADLVSVPVDASFSDIMDNFDFGLQGHFEARKNRFGLGLDFVYTNLGVPVAPGAPIVDYEVDLRQLIAESFVFYRAASGARSDNPAHLDVILGGRYTGTKTRLSAQTSTGIHDGESETLDWVDAVAGVKFRAPLGSRAALLGRADVAGFGSNVTWNLEGDLAFRASERWSLGAGWRYMDIDYDNGGEGLGLKKLELDYSGPRIWAAYSW
jgi:hypothetical protein